MENINIGIVATLEYGEMLEKTIEDNYMGVNTRIYDVKKDEILNNRDDIYLIEWEAIRKNKIDFGKLKGVFLVDKIPIVKECANKELDNKIVMSKYDNIKNIMGEAKIDFYAKRTGKGFAEDVSKTKVIAAILFSSENTLLNEVEILYKEEKTLVITFKKWIEDESIEEKNDLRRFMFYLAKGKEGIVYNIEEFIKEKKEKIFLFKQNQVENPIFRSESSEILKMVDDIRKSKKFTQVIFDLGLCEFNDYEQFLEYSSEILIFSEEKGENREKIKNEILKSIENKKLVYTLRNNNNI